MKPGVGDGGWLSAREAARGVARGDFTVEALVTECLRQIESAEPRAQAWQYYDPAQIIAAARRLDHAPAGGRLKGVLLGVKDVIATVDMPTEYGSALYAGFRPPYDASCVALSRAAGVLILGKTVTTEFAALSPGLTRNPHNPAHTPGGSSSGSAAAVAAGMVPLALSTQTGGSTIRPAAYCGIVGYKPTFGMIDIAGVKPLAPALDTVGVLGRDVRDVAFYSAAMTGRDGLEIAAEPAAPLVGLWRGEAQARALPETWAAIDRAVAALEREGANVREIAPVAGFDDLLEVQAGLFDWGLKQALSYEDLFHREAISAVSRRMFDDRAGATAAGYDAAAGRARAARARLENLFAGFDVILTPSAPGEAPLGLDSTGDPVFNRVWTMLHVPCVTVPTGHGPNGLPVGVQIVGRIGDDARTLDAAAFLEAALA